MEAYNTAIRLLGNYDHASLNHSPRFDNPEKPETHTQNLEVLWSRFKFFFKTKNLCEI